MSLPNSCRELMNTLDSPSLFEQPASEILPAQLRAAQDLFEERKGQIDVLRQRAEDCGVDRIRSPKDIVPLLFSHTTYKSYPETFVTNGRWDRLTKWYATLAAVPVDNVDLTNIKDVDDWVDRMWAAGHYLYATSGTTGKCSFLNHTAADREFARLAFKSYFGWPKRLNQQKTKRRYYQFMPGEGPQAPMDWFRAVGDFYGRADARFTLGREPVRVSYLNRVGAMRKAMAEGTATSDDVAAFEDEMAARERRMQADFKAMAKDVLDHRKEPVLLVGWAMMYELLQIARAEGVPDGDFADVHIHGMARKRYRMPITNSELQADAMRFFGNVQSSPLYGMTELSTQMPACEHVRYHLPPWIMLFVLDRNGNHLVEPQNGIAEGRAGYLDLSREGRWGGIITGDKVQVDYTGTCACGRPGPVILDTISRFSDSNDDKVDCAGTFEAYVRGILEPMN